MKKFTVEAMRSKNRLAWLMPLLVLLVLAIGGGVSMLMVHAAAPSPLSGSYDFRGLTTSGPKNGTYITGHMQLVVNGTTVSGHFCGLNVSSAPSHCTVVAGTASGMNVTLTINSVGNFPVIHAVGTFTNNLIHKGASGFAGTYTVGTGNKVSNGNWTGLNSSVPSIAGTWKFYSVVQQGKEKGHQVHGKIILMPHANDTYTGILCIQTNTPCVPVKGTYQYGYIHLSIGKPVEITLIGTYILNNKHHANGQFYSNDNSTGDKGYWLIRNNED